MVSLLCWLSKRLLHRSASEQVIKQASKQEGALAVLSRLVGLIDRSITRLHNQLSFGRSVGLWKSQAGVA